jgi:hypothetical protein
VAVLHGRKPIEDLSAARKLNLGQYFSMLWGSAEPFSESHEDFQNNTYHWLFDTDTSLRMPQWHGLDNFRLSPAELSAGFYRNRCGGSALENVNLLA